MPEFYKKNLLSDENDEPRLQTYSHEFPGHHESADFTREENVLDEGQAINQPETFAYTPELPSGLEPDHELPAPHNDEEIKHYNFSNHDSGGMHSSGQEGNGHFAQHHDDFWSEDHDPERGENLVKTLISWHAPSRPFRKRDRSYYTTVAILIGLISMIAVLAGEKILIGALFALGFLVYVLNFVPPEDVEYKISTQGITIGDHFYHWQELDSFWFTEKDGHTLLHVLTDIKFPGVLILVLREGDTEEVKRVCARFLPFHEIAPKTMVEKWAESLQKHFPLENPHR